ncbi:hypothetical protein [Corynebacterium sp. A21]|uniref:hypothetical protein n=1 Tax=Corynebacterium sp. A21 TaxID=3457318 RepID=UPI003FD3A2F0
MPAQQFRELPRWDRYDLYCIAAAIARPSNFLVGKAAATAWGIPFGEVPMWIEMGSESQTFGDRDSLLKMRKIDPLPDQPLQQLAPPFDAGRATSLSQSLLDIARWHPLSDALQAIDHSLHHQLISKEQLRGLLPLLDGKTGASAATRALDLAHPASESPRESLLRLKLWEAGFPTPHLQAIIRDRYGIFIGRADYFFPWFWIVLEYDGDGKYQGRFSLSPREAAEAEMRRTKLMGNAGLRLVRVTRSTFLDGSWLDDLWEALEWGKRHSEPFPENQWRSAGLAWGRAKYGSLRR